MAGGQHCCCLRGKEITEELGSCAIPWDEVADGAATAARQRLSQPKQGQQKQAGFYLKQ